MNVSKFVSEASSWLQRSGRLQEKAEGAAAKAKRAQLENPLNYRTPVQVCPRGCGYHELARRDHELYTGVWGRVDITANFVFETQNCPKCGAPLVAKCARCEEDIFAPVVDLCRTCGLPQPWAAERRAGTDRASIRLWRPEKKRKKRNRKERQGNSPANVANDPALLLFRSFRKRKKKQNDKGGKKKSKRGKRMSDLWVIEGDLVHLDVDAVVSNNDVDGQMWAQVARAIKKSAGEGVERLAQEGKPFERGQAWVTTAGNLQHLKGIIHVASMDRRGASDLESARKSLAAALEAAVEKKYRSVALAPFGIATIGRDAWFEMFAKTSVAFLTEQKNLGGKKYKLSVILVLFEPKNFADDAEDLRRLVYEAWMEIEGPKSGVPFWRPDEG
jgi:O-acetyl-ADP-ribose deacetylase (regulator of RNase III)